MTTLIRINGIPPTTGKKLRRWETNKESFVESNKKEKKKKTKLNKGAKNKGRTRGRK